MRDKMVTFRMEQDDFLKLRRKIGLRQFQTGQYMSVSTLLNALIARYLVEDEFAVVVDESVGSNSGK